MHFADILIIEISEIECKVFESTIIHCTCYTASVGFGGVKGRK